MMLTVLLYIITILAGIVLTILGGYYNENIMLGLGTGFMASWITALFIELHNRHQRKKTYLYTNSQLFQLLLRLLTVHSRKTKDAYEAIYGADSFSFENLQLYGLLGKLKDATNKIDEVTAPCIGTNESSAESLQLESKYRKIRENLNDSKDFDAILDDIKKINENYEIQKNVLLANGICSNAELVALKCLLDLLTIKREPTELEKKDTDYIPLDVVYSVFFELAKIYDDILECLPESTFNKIGFDKLIFSNKKLALDIEVKKK